MSKLNLYRYFLPLATNAGLSTERARKAWEAEALKVAGGYTLNAFADGVWQGEGGKVYKDRIAPYDVATDREGAAKLTEAWFKAFPDQEALFVAKLGEATILPRELAALGA
jgi:hypothetical protein